MTPDIRTVVSADVLALTFVRSTREVLLALHRRPAEPFAGDLALPGVVVLTGERLADAAARALAKLGASGAVALGQLRTFDEPSRDPRGPSLSVAMWAVRPPSEDRPDGQWVALDRATGLAFDHDRIVADARPLLAGMLWRDGAFTRALTGSSFSATDAVAITEQLTGRPPHRANLNRDLARIPDLEEAGTTTGRGGRPPKLWRWRD